MRLHITAKLIATVFYMATCFAVFSCKPEGSCADHVNRMLSTAIATEDSDAVAALDIYEEALDILGQCPDTTLLRETHFRMGLLFFRNALPDESIVELKEAARLDSVLCDTISWQKTLRSIALAYESMGLYSSARESLRRVIEEMPDNYSPNYGHMYSDYYTRYNEMQTMTDEIADAHIENIDHLTPKSTELEYIYEGWIAERNGDYERAIRCYRKLSKKYSYYVRAFGQLHTARILMSLGKKEEACESLNEYEESNGMIRKGEKITKQLLQHHANYQDRRAQREISELSQHNEHLIRIIVIVTTLTLLTIVFLILLLHIHRQRQLILKFRIDKMRQWREEYLARGDDRNNDKSKATQQSDIFKLLKLKLNGGDNKPMTDSDWDSLEQSIIKDYPHFRQRLYDLCRLSTHDYHICLLLKTGMKPSDIARLTIRSDEAISSTRRRLYQRAFGSNGSPSDWDEVIKTL